MTKAHENKLLIFEHKILRKNFGAIHEIIVGDWLGHLHRSNSTNPLKILLPLIPSEKEDEEDLQLGGLTQ